MASITEEYVENVVTKVIFALNLSDSRHTVCKLENVGQNYFGVIVPVCVTGRDETDEKTVDIILKLAPIEEKYRTSGAVTLMFAREIFAYSTILKMYSEIQEKFPFDSKLVIPKCYFICKDYCKEAIAMQNMCQENYQPFTHSTVLDYEHITISLKACANFHALSFIFKERYRNLYDEAAKSCVPLTELTNKRFMGILEDRLCKAIRKFENTKYLNLLMDLKENCIKYVEATSLSAKKLSICHGDLWKENILFKYESNKPVSACLIDYQTTRMSSPAFDVLYLITCCTDSNLRKDRYQELLDIYYDKFTETLALAGIDFNDAYPMEEFHSDLKIIAPACLIIANTAFWLSNGLQEDGNVRSKHVWTTPEEKEAAVNKYKKIIQNIIEDYQSYGYLQNIKSNAS